MFLGPRIDAAPRALFLDLKRTEVAELNFLSAGKLDVRLVNVVWPNDAITPAGKVREIVTEGSRRRALVDVWCAKTDGTVTIVGTASAVER